MLSARVIRFMKNKKSYDSIVTRLIISIVIIFVLMVLVSNFLINRKQIMIMEEVFEGFSRNFPENNESVVLLIDSAQVQSTSAFRLYLGLVVASVVLIGSLTFVFIIKRTLKPLNKLEEKIGRVDIENPDSFSENLVLVEGPTEIKELSEKFDDLVQRIYKDYKKQKEFSSNVAHELRTPIAIMQAQVDVFREKNTDENNLDFIETMDSNIKRLKNLIDSVLLLSKRNKLKISSVNLDDMIDEILFDLDDFASKKNISLDYHYSNISIDSDDVLIQRLIFNIVENAIKYTEEGGLVDVNVSQNDKETVIRISDTGIGISDEKKEEIFDLFYQVDDSRNKEGFGIGLSLSKDIAETLGARIEVRDNKPKGTIFLIKFRNI